VLIAGAGPTGLTLACGLLANGVAVRVVDKAFRPAGTSRALCLQPRGIEVVDRLGALNGLPDRALEVEQIVVRINGTQAASVRVGQRKLARYQLADGTRAIVAQRIDGRVAISDIPVDHAGRVYLIERHVHRQAELAGLVQAYVEHSRQAGCPAVIAQRRQLDELVDAVA
jgi:cation diffusion facilitator CzcD-associated flavoprotein CzcO